MLTQMERRRAVQFQDRELTLLIELYAKNYARYHGSYANGGRVERGVREALHMEWAEILSSLGIAPRSKSQIEEKIRNERKKVHRFLMAEEKMRTTGEVLPHFIPLPAYLEPLIQAMAENHDNSFHMNGDDSSISFYSPEVRPCTSAEEQLFTADEDKKPDVSSMLETMKEEDVTRDCSPAEPIPMEIQTRKPRKRSHAFSAQDGADPCNEARTTLYLEEAKLARLRQEEVRTTTELRKKELEKVNLEIELLKARKQFYEARRPPYN